MRRLRAAWYTLVTGRTYYDGYYAGRRAGYSAGLDDGELIIDAINARRAQPAAAHPTIAERRRHLTLVGGAS